MSNLLLQVFDQSAGVEPANCTKLEGGIQKTVCDGAGTGYSDSPSSAVMYRYNPYPGRADYGAQLKVKWSDPTGAGHRVRLQLDVIDAQNYLFLEVTAGSNIAPWTGLGTPQMAFGKVVGGVDSLLDGPTTVNGGASLTADQLYTWEITRLRDPATGIVTYEMRFEDSWLDVPRPAADATYQSATLTHRNERLGWRFETAGTTAQKIDDLLAFELSTTSQDAADRRLVAGGATLDGDEMVAAGLSPVELTKSYVDGATFVFEEVAPWATPSFAAEQYVEWRDEGHDLFRGFLHKVEYGGKPGAQTIRYTCRGRKTRMRYVTPRHATTLAHRLVINGDDEDYLSATDKAAFTFDELGEAVQWYFDTYEEELAAVGAIRPDGSTPYSATDLAAMTMRPLRTELFGDCMQQISQLLAQYRAYGFALDHENDVWRFGKVTGLPVVALQTRDDKLAGASLSEDSTGVYTQVCISSVQREKKRTEAKLSDGSLDTDWLASLESEWTPERSRRKKTTVVVTSFTPGGGVGGGDRLTVTYDSPSTPFGSEWLGCDFSLTSGAADGETLKIVAQSVAGTGPYTGTIDLDGNLVGTPVATDTAEIEAVQSKGQFNGFYNVFRRFKITDALKQDVVTPYDGGCAALKLWSPAISEGAGGATKESEKKAFFDATGASAQGPVSFDALHSPISTAGSPALCGTPGSYQLPTGTGGDISFEYDYWELTILQRCKPSSGYDGDAYDDLGVERTLPLEDSAFRDASQNAYVDERAQEILDVVSQRQWTGTPEFTTLLYGFRNLWVSLQLTSPSAVLPMASAYILPIQVTYRYARGRQGGRTHLKLGGTAGFAASGQRLATKLQEETTLEKMRALDARMREIEQCYQNQSEGAAGVSAGNGQARVCAESVLVPDGQGGAHTLDECDCKHEVWDCTFLGGDVGTVACDQYCDGGIAGKKPIKRPDRLQTNGDNLDGFAVRTWIPEGANFGGLLDAAKAASCLAQHTQEQWFELFRHARAFNHTTKVISDEILFVVLTLLGPLIIGNDQCLQQQIDALNICMKDKQDATIPQSQSPCWESRPCPISESIAYQPLCEKDLCQVETVDVACDDLGGTCSEEGGP